MIIHHYNEDYLNGQDGVGDNDDQDDRGGYGNHNHAHSRGRLSATQWG